MAWKLEGQYFENCSCDVPCPCTVSLDFGADRDRCNAFLVFQVEAEPARLVGVFHPAGDDLTIARATKSRVSAFGIDFAFEGGSGFANPFAWAA